MYFRTLLVVFDNNRPITAKDVWRGASFGLCILSLALVTGCSVISARAQRNEARRSLNQLVSDDLPQIEGLEILEIVSSTWSRTEYSQTCHYARDYLIIGAFMPVEEALERYFIEAELMGWIPRDIQYDSSRVLRLEEHARLVVETSGPGVDIRDAIDYEQARDVYQSLLFVRVDFMLPQRDGC
jgi:hypothetical protein